MSADDLIEKLCDAYNTVRVENRKAPMGDCMRAAIACLADNVTDEMVSAGMDAPVTGGAAAVIAAALRSLVSP